MQEVSHLVTGVSGGLPQTEKMDRDERGSVPCAENKDLDVVFVSQDVSDDREKLCTLRMWDQLLLLCWS